MTLDSRVPRESVNVRSVEGHFLVKALSKPVWISSTLIPRLAPSRGRLLAVEQSCTVTCDEFVYLLFTRAANESSEPVVGFPIRFRGGRSSALLLHGRQELQRLTMTGASSAAACNGAAAADTEEHVVTELEAADGGKERSRLLRQLLQMSRRQAKRWEDQDELKHSHHIESGLAFRKDARGARWSPLGQLLCAPWTLPTRSVLDHLLVDDVNQELSSK